MSKEKYEMILVECGSGWGAESWVIFPAGGSYFADELCKLPGGSEIQRKKALEVLNAMNN